MLQVLTADDAEPVAALIRSAFSDLPVQPDPPMSALRVTGANVVAHLQRGGGGAVAEIDGRLAGCALWAEAGGGLYVGRVAVAPQQRRRGIARALMAAAEQMARAAELPRLHLATRLVLTDNRRLFAACGFVETGQTAHPGYAAPTSVTMEKRLSAAKAV